MKTNIGKRIRQARLMRNLSQENVAEAIGMSPGNFGKIERGEVSLSIENLERIAFHLGIPLSSLIQENQANENSPDYTTVSKADLARVQQNIAQLQFESEQIKAVVKKLEERVDKLQNNSK